MKYQMTVEVEVRNIKNRSGFEPSTYYREVLEAPSLSILYSNLSRFITEENKKYYLSFAELHKADTAYLPIISFGQIVSGGQDIYRPENLETIVFPCEPVEEDYDESWLDT